eukprot:PhM_4_TR16909/c0_g2_i1/m.26043
MLFRRATAIITSATSTRLGASTTMPQQLLATATRAQSQGSSKSPGFSSGDVDPNKMSHPYWDTMDFDDTFFMDELYGEFESEFDFEVPMEDLGYLQDEWKGGKK